MNSSAISSRAMSVVVTDETLSADLADGRTIVVPLAWFPRLLHATARERKMWRLIGGGAGIHWPGIDEDISIVNLLTGQRSAESQASLKKWLAGRAKPRREASPKRR